MSTGGFFSSDLFSLHNVVQNVQILYPKELLISALRGYFAKDSKYHYVKDAWGFPKTPDHTDLPLDAGENDDETTRIYIGNQQRYDVNFLPSVLVKHNSSSFVPVSINEEKECIQYGYRKFIDANNKEYNIQVPIGFIFAGMWDLSFSVEILAEGPQDRSTICEAVSILFQSIVRDELTRAGLFIKKVSTDGESSEQYQNDMIYKQTVTLECRGEYRRCVPVQNVIEAINLCVDFGNIDNNTPDPNLQIIYNFDLSDIIMTAEPL